MNRIVFALALAVPSVMAQSSSQFRLIDLGMMAGPTEWSFALSINNAGRIVGASNPPDDVSAQRAILWTGDAALRLDNLAGIDGASEGYVINNRGQMAGQSVTSSGEVHAAFWDNGTVTDLGTLAGANGKRGALAFGINDLGDVVGSSVSSTGQYHAVLWRGGTITDLGTLDGDDFSEASAVNNQGQIVGYSLSVNFGEPRGVLWEKGTVRELGSLVWANAINERGQVAGAIDVSSSYRHAAIWENGIVTDLGTLPGGNHSEAWGINAFGQVVGFGTTSTGATHAILWERGRIIDLGTLPGAVSSHAWGINDHGQIVGESFVISSNTEHAVLWTR